MAEHLILISADGHAGPPIAEFRPYVDADLRDEFEEFLVAREAWRAERNRSMGLNEGDELVHALFGEQMVQLYTNQEAVSSGVDEICVAIRDLLNRSVGLAERNVSPGLYGAPR